MARIKYKGRKIRLSKLYPAMIREDPHMGAQCRTLYEDEEGGLWCFWFGKFRRVEDRELMNWPKDGRVTRMYVVDTTDTEDSMFGGER